MGTAVLEGPDPSPRADNSQLYAEFRRIAGEQAALRRVATLVAQGPAPGQVFAAVTEEAVRLLVADFATLVRYDSPEQAITVVGTWTSNGAPAPTRSAVSCHSAGGT